MKKIIIEDGEFDCTERIQNAIDRGAEEIILRGLHGVSGSISIPANVRIVGEVTKERK